MKPIGGDTSDPEQPPPPYYIDAIGAAHFHAAGSHWRPNQGNVDSIWGQQSNEAPYVDTTGDYPSYNFSLSQLWFIDEEAGSANVSTAEFGWQVNPVFYADGSPHLFVFGARNGYTPDSCYVRPRADQCVSNWHPYDTTLMPGDAVSNNDVFHRYGIARNGAGYWFYYDGRWLGYLDPAYWSRYPSTLSRLDAGGEVATPHIPTCTDMGFGVPGSQGNAAMWQQVWYGMPNGQSANAQLNDQPSDPQYTIGNQAPGASNYYAFRYGGGGYC